MENEIKLRQDNIVEIKYRGEQTKEKIENIADELVRYSKKLREQGIKVNVLICLKEIRSTSSEARKAASNTLKMDVYDKIAVYGGNLFFKYLTKLVVKASNRDKTVKYFDEIQEAKNWLNQK